MNVVAVEHALSEQQRSAVWSILCACRDEFVPPLSQRLSTTQVFAQKISPDDCLLPTDYFNELLKQPFLLIQSDDLIIGFLSYQTDYVSSVLAKYTPSVYVTTICIHPDYRGRGALNQLYDALEEKVIGQSSMTYITTRTWSTNKAQMHTLEKRGFKQIKTIPNDRGPGIDTLYFAKKVNI